MREFTGAVFEGSVERTTMFLLAVLGILLTVVLAPGGWQWKVAGSALVILTYTTVTFGLRAYQFFNTFQRPINVIRQVQGIGLTASETFLVLRNPGYLRDNDLLMLYSPTSGADQPLSLLKVTRCVARQNMHAIAYPPGVVINNLSSYFDGDNKNQLYATPVVHSLGLERALTMAVNTQTASVAALGDIVVIPENSLGSGVSPGPQ